MIYRWLAMLVAAVWSAAFVSIGAAHAQPGPWNLEALNKPPRIDWLDKDGSLRRLLYESEPYHGKPTRVFAYYAQPEKFEGKLPAMVLVHGGGGTAFPEWAQLWARRGYIAIAMDLAGHGEGRKRLPDGGPDQDDNGRFKQGELKDMWSYHAVAAVIRGHSLLRSLPNVDPERIGVTGISWGGYLTCIVAGLDERFKVAVPVYGCGFIHSNSAWIPTFAKMSKDWHKTWEKNFDPSRYLGQSKMPVLFVNGTNDFAYPLDSYQKSYRLVKKRNLCITVNMPHGHPQGWAPKEIGLFVDQHLRGGKALFRFDAPDVRVERKDGAITVAILQTHEIKSISVHWTTDTSSPWQKRKWESRQAERMVGNATDFYAVSLPGERPLIYFLTATDERGAVVSTEHEMLSK
ncbi:MAG: alpha/beta fold hydrolase [Planctomycetes bacterium]|nr:alpha/beta fold hydrolase [Planctomycetota bacterium]